MKILFLTYYFAPDLSAGSFRNTSLFEELKRQLGKEDFIHVIASVPNRYYTYQVEGKEEERGENFRINRIFVPSHKSGMRDQAYSYVYYYKGVMKIIKDQYYDLVYASSSRLFTAFLGKRCAVIKKAPLYLDIRDIFIDSIKDILREKKMMLYPLIWGLKLVEWYSFGNAHHINLISEGFCNYFKKYPKPQYSEYTNGIDELFVEAGKKKSVSKPAPYIITYAGNIGGCQGLEKIIPEAAKKLGENYLFRVIGEGSTKYKLIERLGKLQVKNVELLNPVPREELLEYYHQTTFFFFHLNNLRAYEKVLPSKMFEYGAFDKPIIAGVAGFANDFIRKNIKNVILFEPADVDGLVNALQNYSICFEYRDSFISCFARNAINKEMAKSIIRVGKPIGECDEQK